MTTEERFMARCLYLANLGKYRVAPNPMVGAVIVYNNRIIGEGYHQEYGKPHAEPNAIHSVKEEDKLFLSESTLYVNLEPCSHYGKTPPCAALIVSKKIKKVVIGTLDPNPKVAGRGVKILEEAGIEVSVGILEKEALFLNRRFFTFQTQKRPFIILKWAQSADGFIDKKRTSPKETPTLISNPITQKMTHKMRAENMGIMVGKNTVLLDNPSLTVRSWRGQSPIRIAFDRKNEIPESFKIKNNAVKSLIIGNTTNKKSENLVYLGVEDTFQLTSVLEKLYHENIHSILVEGGSTLLQSFLSLNVWDEINVEITPVKIFDGVKSPTLPNNAIETSRSVIEKNLWLHFERK